MKLMVAYDVAREFIRLGDIMRTLEASGARIPTSMLNEQNNYRWLLDGQLKSRKPWTSAEVQRRFSGTVLPPTVNERAMLRQMAIERYLNAAA